MLSKPWRLAIDAVLMILPPVPWAIICFAASWMPISTPRALTFMMKFQFSSVTSRNFIGLFTPALLNMTLRPPNSLTATSIAARICLRSVTSTRDADGAIIAALAYTFRRFGGNVADARVQIGVDYVAAFAQQVVGDRAAHAASRAGYQARSVRESPHVQPPSCLGRDAQRLGQARPRPRSRGCRPAFSH